jgi:hypothetical protein
MSQTKSTAVVAAIDDNFANRLARLGPPKDNFAELVERYVREHGHEHWPHLPDQFPPPKRKPRVRRISNPWWQVKTRPSSLRREVVGLYNAMAFAMWQHGLVMNAHMTIAWAELGIRDHRRAADLLPLFNHEASKWLSVGASSRPRKRASARSWEEGSKHIWIYVHEHGRDQGFHTHELMHIPRTKATAFAEWARRCIGRLAGGGSATETAVYITPVTKRRGFQPYDGGNKLAAVSRHWAWFRYLTKTLHPDHRERVPGSFIEASARNIFHPDEPFVETEPVSCEKIAGCSENIGKAAQRKAGFKSRFDAGDWQALYEGFELDEYRQRLREEAHAREMAEIMERLKI